MTPLLKGSSSLRLHLMAWLVLPVALILAISVWLSYGGAVRQGTLLMDQQLIASARIIAEQIGYSDGNISVVIPPSALELFASDGHDEVAYAVIGQSGILIAGFPGLEMPANMPPVLGHEYFATMFRTEAMRAIVLRQPIITPKGTVSVSVVVGETLKARDELVRSLWVRGFVEESALVLAAALSIWIGINRELKPLLRLRQAVLDRPASQFEPFDAGPVQSEIRPLVEALNSHMRRLESQLRRQRRFLDTAAHQLRTPLAIMKTQIGYARRTAQPTEKDATLQAVDDDLSAMSRLTNQLLTLGRVEHDRASLQTRIVQLDHVVRGAVSDAAPRALDAGVELVLEVGEVPCRVLATDVLIREIAGNLIDNAIAYAGSGTVTIVSVRHVSGNAVLTVADNGAGVGVEERTTLLERFRRGRNADAGGSGLGLSIVAEIAEMFGGSVEIGAPSGGGFSVSVTLPLAQGERPQSGQKS